MPNFWLTDSVQMDFEKRKVNKITLLYIIKFINQGFSERNSYHMNENRKICFLKDYQKTMTYFFPNNLITERFITEVRPLINLIYRNIESCLQR